jgi:glycolate oxidase iron-sulfur subunit
VANIKELTTLMRQLEDQLVVCMRCGMCQAVCPVFAQTGREADVARGKLALLDGLLLEMFDDPRGVNERLNRCLLCGSCAANCPSGVNVLDIFLKARAIITGYLGLPAAKKVVLRRLLAHPHLLDRVAEWGAKFQKVLTRPVNDIVGTSCARFASPLLADRHFRPLAPVPFHRLVPSLNSKPGGSGLKVALFVGCLIDKIFPNIAQATIKVLAHHGVGVFIPEGQGCCGIPAISSGDSQTFRELVRYNLDKFATQEFDYLVTACATCTSTIKKIWPSLLDTESRDLRDAVRSLAERVVDINQFLVNHLSVPTVPSSGRDSAVKVSYHDPCHLKKSLGVATEPRLLLRSTPGYELVEMPEADSCCGMGGSFNLSYYDLSSRIGRLKRDHIKASGCSVVATGCPACMLQISEMLSKHGDQIAVKHPVEIYAGGLPGSVSEL